MRYLSFVYGVDSGNAVVFPMEYFLFQSILRTSMMSSVKKVTNKTIYYQYGKAKVAQLSTEFKVPEKIIPYFK